MKRDKIIVFGGAGFLGGYVVYELETRGYEVIVADLYESKYQSGSKFIHCDILNFDTIINAIPDDISFVYNFAGFASLEKANNDPVNTVQLNINGNLNVLEASRQKGCKQFIFASSAYAMTDKGSFYGISKLASEKIVEEYKKKYNLDYTIIRYGSVYSERDFDNNYIYGLIKNAVLNKEIIHSGDGEEIREYIHAADAAVSSADIIEDAKYKNQHIILTGHEKIKRIELFQMINEIMGGELTIKLQKLGYKSHYKTTPYSFQPTVSKKLINNPYIDMGQGILECIKQVNKQTNIIN